jgi:hypothetical protein
LLAVSEREDVIRRWGAAEERLYPVVMLRPDLYERYISVVRAVADELRSIRTPDELVEAYARGPEIVARVIRDQMVSTEGMDLGLVTAAAFGHRHREVLADSHRARAVRRIEDARATGEGWVVVYETGSQRPLLPPYRRLEMRLADGLGLHVFVEVDPETAGPLYGVEVVQLDPRSGDWVSEAATERLTFGAPDEWEGAIERLRRRHET